MLLRKIPIEVWENVIDHLEVYFETLLACASVCRGWTARSRLHLRKRLRLRLAGQVARLAKLVRTGSWEVESCRTVQIHVKLGSKEDHTLRTLSLFAAMFAGKMPRLEELAVSGSYQGRWKWKPGEMHVDVFLHLSAFTSIARLSLSVVTFPSVQTFGRLLSALPSLSNLQCSWIHFEARDLNVGGLIRRPRNLATLDLDTIDLRTMNDISRLLVGTEMASTLKEITFGDLTAVHSLHKSGIPALVSHAGASLQVLSFVLEAGTLADGEPAPEINLSQLVNLQHARFDMRGGADDWLPWVCNQFASYPTSTTALRTLTLRLYLDIAEDTDFDGFNVTMSQKLDDILSISPFTSLKDVLLEIVVLRFNGTPPTATTLAQVRQVIPAQFPKLAARGILRLMSLCPDDRVMTAD